MLDLLTELHYLEAHYSELNTHLRDSMVRIEWTKSLSKLQLDTNDFNKARSFYGENGKAFGELEQKVLERVRQMEMK
ncbi:MAG TPA: hypothetical protein VFX48_01415 [Saprospiraceae bacterium]|nr:hypothetical protein [Saprospiraceae bacterium]